MARRLTMTAALAALLSAGAMIPTPAGAQGTQSPATGSQFLKWDAAKNTVTFELIAGYEGGGAKSPFNFNGYVDGEANLIVPPGSTVIFNFAQKDGTPHSAIVIDDKDPMPNMADEPAIPRAYTDNPIQGLPQESTNLVRFTAPESGSFRIFCGVPGHGLSGMWIRFTVDPAAKEPRFETPSRG